jgi:glycosyltransferase involved in cell wall biosynthesis
MAFAYLETQACGRVLIASDIAGAREVVENGVNGILVDSGDVSAMAEATLRAAADADLRASIGARAREFAVAHPLSRAIDRFETLLTAVVDEHRARR